MKLRGLLLCRRGFERPPSGSDALATKVSRVFVDSEVGGGFGFDEDQLVRSHGVSMWRGCDSFCLPRNVTYVTMVNVVGLADAPWNDSAI